MTHPERALTLRDRKRLPPVSGAAVPPPNRLAALQALADRYAARYGDTPQITQHRRSPMLIALNEPDIAGLEIP